MQRSASRSPVQRVGRKPLLAVRAGAFLIAISLGIPATAAADRKHDRASFASAGINLIAHPKRNATSSHARFAWRTARRERLSCRLDGGRFRPCSRSASYRRLSTAPHRFVIRSARRGVVLRHTWRVLASARAAGRFQLRITQRPSDPSYTGDATFAWTTSAPASATCLLDGSSVPCASPKRYSGIQPGRHTFIVKVVSGKYAESTSASWTVMQPTPTPDPAPSATATPSATPTPAPTATPTPDTTYNRPVDLVTTNVGDTSAYLDWSQDYSRSYDGYYVRVNDGARKAYTASEGVVPGLNPGTTYTVCVSINYTSSSDPDESPQSCIVFITSGTSDTSSPAPAPAPAPTATPTPTPTATPTPTPTATPTPTPAPAAETLWKAGHETGSLGDWYFPSTSASGSYGGGEYNSGAADSTASTDRAHSGSWSAKMSMSGAGGTRLFRWNELWKNRAITITQWMYFPSVPTVGNWWWLQEFKTTRQSDGNNQASWVVNAYNPSPGVLRGRLSWVLYQYDRTTEGPRPGQYGNQNYAANVNFPIGEWFKSTIYIKQSKDFDGEIKWWINDQLQVSQANVRTAWPSNKIGNAWQTDMGYASISYGEQLSPAPYTYYVDDLSIDR